MISDDTIFSTLAEVFGFHTFRRHQEDIVRAVLQRRDAFAVMPTGGGKSLCYQLPARLLNGVCIVMSPLISLMKDQVDAASANGLRAATLNSTISQSERTEIGRTLRQGELDLLYISPERFNSEHFIERLKTLDISFFAIDEAHCISEWGHDFRPDYLALSRIVDEFPDVPIAAFTATATARVDEDIVNRLKLRDPHRTRASFNRPNLFYSVEPKQNVDEQLCRFVSGRKDESGIIYRTSRKKVEATAEMLRTNGISALPYHAGMSDADRHAAQEAFRHDECTVIVATIAFGMGIDKSNVRFVVHGDLPKNIEGYYQETGRAGRDGAMAQCTLFYGKQDVAILSHFIDEMEDETAKEVARLQLRQMIRFAAHDGCRRTALLEYFDEKYLDENCGGCDVCCGYVEREDATVSAQKILSAIYRTEQRFGAVHVCDVVVGADTEKIRSFRHNELSTYGVGKDRPKTYWRSVIDALQTQNILVSDDPSRPILKLTEEAWKILRSQRTFEMLRQQETVAKKSARRTAQADVSDLDAFGHQVFDELRKKRTEIAKAEKIPPYIVFSDRTLLELALYLPESEDALLQINGIGRQKLDKYGERILEVIRRLSAEDHAGAVAARRHPMASEMQRLDSKAPPTHRETLRLFEEGKSVEEIASARKFAKNTIVSHLEKAAQEGHQFEIERFFTPARFERIAAWFRESDSIDETGIRLKPAVEASGGDMDYDEARLARLFLFE